MMDNFQRSALDNYITGHYGENQFNGDLPEVECESCFWQGDTNELIDGKCPQCKSDQIVDYED